MSKETHQPNMEVEGLKKLGNGDQAEASLIGQPPETCDKPNEGSNVEIQTDRTEKALLAENPVGQQDKKREEPKIESPREDRPSKRVREGQRWNDRPRKQYGNQKDRPHKGHNNKSDLTSQQESSDPVAIRKQVEFYFSDSNLLTDKFLFTKVEGHKNLPVPLSIIHSFKRMRHFQPLSAVIDALKESVVLDVVDDDTAIQRKTPLPEGLVGKPMVEIQRVHEDKSMARSIYAKGFGEEQPSTQFDTEAFFAQHGSTNSVRLRRSFDGRFKGSVFVEFDTEETQKAFLALNPKPKWQGNELQIKSKKQYCDDKVDDIAAGRVRPNEDDRSHQKGGRDRDRQGEKGGRRGKDNRDDNDTRDWRVRRAEDRKDGFKDRNGEKHKGFGSSGRGRGGGRDRERWDRSRNKNDEIREKEERESHEVKTSSTASGDSAERPAEISTDVTAEPKNATEISNLSHDKAANMVPGAATTTADASSKKRIREDDDEAEDQRITKKVDSKVEES